MPDDEQLALDLAAAVAARRELGPQFDDAIARGLVERVESLMAAPATSPPQQAEALQAFTELQKTHGSHQYVLALASLGAGIPITAVGADGGLGLLGTAVAWTGIAALNLAHALARPRRR